MPIKRRRPKNRVPQLSPEVFASFEAGDKYALRRALGLPPWHASPIETDLDRPAEYPEGWASTRPAALELRLAILAALKRGRKSA